LAGPVACLVVVGPAAAGSVSIDGAGGSFTVPVVSMREARWERVVAQAYDYSCGAAAVATLLTHHYGRPTLEETVFAAMFAAGDQDAIRRHGFSMLDMKQYLNGLGLRADGFRLGLDKIAEIGVPGITMIQTSGYKHFVVIKGVRDGKVLVADPAQGTAIYPLGEFESLWNGAFLAAREEFTVGREHFNRPLDWRVRPKASAAATAEWPSAADLLVHVPIGGEF
jgi:predicted double-glycine peptidase